MKCCYCREGFVVGQIVTQVVTRAGFVIVPVHGYRCAARLRAELNMEAM